MAKDVNKVDEKMQVVDAYHEIMMAVEEFGRVSANVPKTLLEVTQHIYGRYDKAAIETLHAANTFELEEKAKSLGIAQECLFYQFNGLETLVKAHGLTIGAANNVIAATKIAHESIKKWRNSVLRDMAKNTSS